MGDITIRVSEKALRMATIGIAGTIVVCLFSYLWSSGLFIPKYQLSVYVPEASGLTVGSPVLLDTVPVGKVNTVKLAEISANATRRIELNLSIEKRYQNDIRSDSTATVMTQGLLGSRIVSIQRGFSGPAIDPGKEIPFVQTPVQDFSKLLARLRDCQQPIKPTEGTPDKRP